jgi:hypothetical protein
MDYNIIENLVIAAKQGNTKAINPSSKPRYLN